ncbi:ABC transporter substrate-binding protein [Leifsonia xyli]|uniref:ABC transporter substrate-binding protein n=1 Tax=Leifsonia xyli TaxID=1575 RepID=UPI0003068B46|nr:ABC transporter substrate-binding protein [Leifsonia xyli]
MEKHPIERRPRRRVARVAALIATTAAIAATLSACAGASSASTNGSSLTLVQKQKVASVADFGGMDALVAAAKAEGHLNVITLPPSWANYGKIIAGFQKKYPGIQVNSENPNGSSADEVAAARAQKGQSSAPDVFDIGTSVLSQNLDLVTPYKVSKWSDIPAEFKDPKGAWYYDYTGLMSIGYDSKAITTAPASIDDLLGAAYHGKVVALIASKQATVIGEMGASVPPAITACASPR